MICLFVLIAVFQLKHMLCDFPLQSDFMRIGKAKETDWLAPLLMHCGVHAAGTFIVTFAVCKYYAVAFPEMIAFCCTLFDFGTHWLVDLIKARMPIWMPSLRTSIRYYWWSMGVDQFAHHLGNLAIVAYLVRLLVINGML
jgi:hypothetical protein